MSLFEHGKTHKLRAEGVTDDDVSQELRMVSRQTRLISTTLL